MSRRARLICACMRERSRAGARAVNSCTYTYARIATVRRWRCTVEFLAVADHVGGCSGGVVARWLLDVAGW
uniref:Uncharacterized protein n=1 Tax=Oryza sativa subsp. japonica TaxID=39947 RepID=Q6YTU0_ORYSJ|nr:hypothetical protein [Oryza sativa Japonica Group]BAD10701.1 hypothetical protein [Oryza sativa Japonica Group]